MKISELSPGDIDSDSQAIQGRSPASAGSLKLSQLGPSDVEYVAENPLEAKHGGIGQQALGGIEAIARGGTLGFSDLVENQLAKIHPDFGPEARKGREAANPYTAILGNIVGAGALTAATAGFGLPAAAARGARALTLGESVGALSRGASAAADIAGMAGEGAVLGTGNAVSDYAGGDPELDASKILAHVGMGAAIGGGLGVLGKAFGALPAMLRKGEDLPELPLPEDPAGILKDAGLGNGETPLTGSEQLAQSSGGVGLRESLPIDALEEADKKPIVEGLNNLKSNADEIIAAGQKLGAPVPEGMLTDSEHLQKLDHALTNSPSPQGIKRNILYNASHDKATESISKTLGEGGELSLAQAGNQVKDVVSNAFETQYEPIKNLYSEIETLTPEVPISDKSTKALSRTIGDLVGSESLIKGTPEHSFVETFSEGVNQIKNMDQLKSFRTALQRATSPETRYVSGLIKDKLDALESKAIGRYAEEISDPEAKAAILKLSDQISEAKGAYSQFREEMGSIGKTLWGGKKIYGFQDFIDKIEAETPERFAGRLFSKNNSEALQALHEKLPEVTQILSQFERAKIRSSSMVKGQFSANKMLSQLEKMSPEVKAIMFTPEELNMFKAGKTYFDNFLPNFNPSGTAGATAYQTFIHNPKSAAINWIKDFGLSKYVKYGVNLTPEQRAAAQLDADKATKLKGILGITDRIGNQIKSGAKSIFESTIPKSFALSTGVTLSDKDYDRITNQIGNYSANPQSLLDHVTENTGQIYHAAPQLTQSLNTKLMQGISYLQDKMPKPGNLSPFATEWKPSIQQKNQFEQHFKGVNDPLGAFASIKSATLTDNQMKAMQAVHPQLLQEMRIGILNHFGKNMSGARSLSYPQKLALSKFLGQPLDNNMSPLGIISNQMALSGPNLSQQTSQAQAIKGGIKKLDFSGRAGTQTERKRED